MDLSYPRIASDPLVGTLAYPEESRFFQTADWFRCLHDAVFPESRVHVCSPDASRVVLHGAGRMLKSFTNYYTQEFFVGENVDALVDELRALSPAKIDLQLLPEEDAFRLAAALGRRGFFARTYFKYENWYATVGGRSFADFMKDRPSQLTNTIRRKKKKLEAAHKVEIRLDRTPERLADFVAIYERSWKQPEPYPAFMPTLAATCARLGLLRLGTLYVDGVPAASQFWINTPQKATIYKLAYDERYREQSVGSILSAEMFRDAIDRDGVAEIDYGVGSEPYKRDWMEGVRRKYGVVAYNKRTLSGAIGGGVEWMKARTGSLRAAAVADRVSPA